MMTASIAHTPSHSEPGRSLGFTLLELLVVVAIIALLASFVGPKIAQHLSKAERSAAKAQLDAFSKALTSYRIDVGNYPTTEQGLAALALRPNGSDKWNGPYLAKALPADPWGKPYIYRFPSTQSQDFDLLTLGRDGQPGGSGEDADISVWDSGR